MSIILSTAAPAGVLVDAISETHVVASNVARLSGAKTDSGHVDDTDATNVRYTELASCARSLSDSALVYAVDGGVGTIREVNTNSGAATTVAGLHATKAFAEGGAGTGNLHTPADAVYLPAKGLLYLTDSAEHVIASLDVVQRTIARVAGISGSQGSNDGDANVARFNVPSGITADLAAGDVMYVMDKGTHRIRSVTVTGTAQVATMAGSGTAGTTDGFGTAAEFNEPRCVRYHEADAALFSVGDQEHRVRHTRKSDFRVDTIAGDGTAAMLAGYGTAAQVTAIRGLAFDFTETMLYMSAYAAHQLWRLDLSTASVSHVAGTGSDEWDFKSNALSAKLKAPAMLCVGGSSWQHLYVGGATLVASVRLMTSTSDMDAGLDTRILEGGVSFIAGVSGTAGSTDGTGAAARLQTTRAVFVPKVSSPEIIFVPDSQGAIREVNLSSQAVSTILAGSGGVGDSIEGTAPGGAQMDYPIGMVALRFSAVIFVGDHDRNRINKLTNDGSPRTLSFFLGDGSANSKDGIGTAAQLQLPHALAVDVTDTTLYFVGGPDHALRSAVIATQVTSTNAGVLKTSGFHDGVAAAARFNWPYHMVLRDRDNCLYVIDRSNSLRRSTSGTGGHAVKTLTATTGASKEGFGTSGKFGDVAFGIVIEPSAAQAALYIADETGNHLWRYDFATNYLHKVAGSGSGGNIDASHSPLTGVVDFAQGALGAVPAPAFEGHAGLVLVSNYGMYFLELSYERRSSFRIAGNSEPGYVDGDGADARFDFVLLCTVDNVAGSGTVYLVELDTFRFRAMTNPHARPNSHAVTVSTVVSSSSAGSTDGTFGTALFDYRFGMYAVGDVVYFTERDFHRIRTLDVLAATITTIAGGGSPGDVDAVGTNARLNKPHGLDLDERTRDTMYIADTLTYKLRTYSLSTTAVGTYVGTGSQGTQTATAARLAATLHTTYTVLVRQTNGDVYHIDSGVFRIYRCDGTSVYVVAGTGSSGSVDGFGTSASFGFHHPGAAADRAMANMYFAEDTLDRIIQLNFATTALNTIIGGTASTSTVFLNANPYANTPQQHSVCMSRGNGPDTLYMVAGNYVGMLQLGSTTVSQSRATTSSSASATYRTLSSSASFSRTASLSISASASYSVTMSLSATGGSVSDSPSASPTPTPPVTTTSSVELSASFSTSESQTHSTSASMSVSWSESSSESESTSDTETFSSSSSPSLSVSTSTSESTSVTESTSISKSTSISESPSESASASQSATTSPSESESPSASPSVSFSASASDSLSPSESESLDQSATESIPLPVPPNDVRRYFPALYFQPEAYRWGAKRVVIDRSATGSSTTTSASDPSVLTWPIASYGARIRMHTLETFGNALPKWNVAVGADGSCNTTTSQRNAFSGGGCGQFRECALSSAASADGTAFTIALSPDFATTTLCDTPLQAHIFVSLLGKIAVPPRYARAQLVVRSGDDAPPATGADVRLLLGQSEARYDLEEVYAEAALDPPTFATLARPSQPAASCRLGDVRSYSAFYGAGTGATLSCVVLDGTTSRPCTSAADAVRVCDASSVCTGFTMAAIGNETRPDEFTEVPLFLHTDEDGSYDAEPDLGTLGSDIAGVLYHRKPLLRELSCVFRIESRGSVQILLSQGAMADGTVTAYGRNGTNGERRYLTDCGGASPFRAERSAGIPVFGASGDCSLHVLCFESGVFDAGSEVELVAPRTMKQRHCGDSLRVLAMLRDSPQLPNPILLPAPLVFGDDVPPLQNLTAVPSRRIALGASSTAAAYGVVHAYVLDAFNASLKVAQTGFACGSERECPATVAIEWRAGTANGQAIAATGVGLAICGGNTTFSERQGLSARCETAWDCAPRPLELPRRPAAAGGGYEGPISFRMDLSFLRGAAQPASASQQCRGFLSWLHVSGAQSSRVTAAGRFPFAPRSAALPDLPFVCADGASGRLPTEIAASFAEAEPVLVTAAIPRSSAVVAGVGLVAVNWTAVPDGRVGVPNVTLACVMDAVEDGRVCRVAVPSGALQVRVRVAQSDFATKAVTVRSLSSKLAPLESVTCGGSEASKFQLDVGRRSACDTFLSCTDAYLPDGAAFVEVAAPAGLEPRGCLVALNAELTFSRPAVVPDVSACTGFVCKSDRTCIARTAVCDGTSFDCPDAADESPCDYYRLAEVDTAWAYNASSAAELAGVSSAAECRREAVMRGSPGFVFSWVNTSQAFAAADTACLIFGSDASLILRAPTAAIIARGAQAAHPGRRSQTFFLVVRKPEYVRCSALLHCSGHGAIRGADTVQDGDPCLCDCNEGWTGATCDARRSLSSPAAYYAILERSPAPFVRAVYEGAIAGTSPGITINALDLVAFNATLPAFEFTIGATDATSLDAFQDGLLAPATAAAANRRLPESVQAFPRFVGLFSTDLTNAFESFGLCTVEPVDAAGFNVTIPQAECTPIGGVSAPASRFRFSWVGFGERVALQISGGPAGFRGRRQEAQSGVGNVSTEDAEFDWTDLACDASASANTATTLLGTESGGCGLVSCIVGLEMAASIAAIRAFPNLSSSSAAADGQTAPSANGSSDAVAGLLANASVPDCAARSFSVAATPPEVEPPLIATRVNSLLLRIDDPRYFVGALTVISFAVCFMVAVAVTANIGSSRFVTVRSSLVSQLEFLRHLPPWVTRTAVLDEVRRRYNCDVSFFVVVLGVLVALLLSVMGLLWTVYEMSKGDVSEADVLVNLYDTPFCSGGSSVRTLPFQIAVVPGNEQCGTLRVAGATRAAVFGQGRCRDSSAESASVVLAATESGCEREAQRPAPRGVCLPIADLFPSPPAVLEGTYVTASCVPVEQGSEYTAYIQRLSSPAPQSNTFVNAPAAENTTDVADGNDGLVLSLAPTETVVTRWPFVTRSSAGTVSSRSPNVLAAVATASDFVAAGLSPLAPDHIALFQSTSGFAIAPDASLSERQLFDEAIAAGSSGLLNLSTSRLRQIPAPMRPAGGGDFPAGFIFNGYGTPNEVSGSRAQRGAHRYYGMRSSPFDVGLDFSADTESDVDGVTISMWMKASLETQGFAFVLADHYETTGGVPQLVEQLMRTVLDGPASTRAWYNDSLSVYAALFVNGPSRTLSFAMMAPENDASLEEGTRRVLVHWSVDAIGQEHILNGGWHHIALALQNQQKKPFVALIIDGKTSLSSNKWRKCLSRRAQPIVRLTELAVDADPIDVTSSADGVMYVGYFNGGIHGLAFTATKISPDAFVRQGTSPMRIDRALRRYSLLALSNGLFICAIVAFVGIVYCVRHMLADIRHELVSDLDEARQLYHGSLHKLYRTYRPVTFDSALAAMDTDPMTFANFVKEVEFSPLDDPRDRTTCKMVRALFLCLHPELLESDRYAGEPAPPEELLERMPTLAEWDAAIRKPPPGDDRHEEEDLCLLEPVPADQLAAYNDELAAAAAEEEDEDHDDDDPETAEAKRKRRLTKKKKRNAKLKRVKMKVKVRTKKQRQNNDGKGRQGGGGSGGRGKVKTTKPEPGAVLLSVIGTLQVAAVYASTWSMPSVYEEWFQPFLNVFAFDFLQYIFSDPLAGPILQLAAVTLLLSGLAFVLVRDDVNFYRNLLRYQHRRDRAEGAAENAISERALNVLLRKIDPDFVIERPFVAEVSVHLLRAEERAAAQIFLSHETKRELKVRLDRRDIYLLKPGDPDDDHTDGLLVNAVAARSVADRDRMVCKHNHGASASARPSEEEEAELCPRPCGTRNPLLPLAVAFDADDAADAAATSGKKHVAPWRSWSPMAGAGYEETSTAQDEPATLPRRAKCPAAAATDGPYSSLAGSDINDEPRGATSSVDAYQNKSLSLDVYEDVPAVAAEKLSSSSSSSTHSSFEPAPEPPLCFAKVRPTVVEPSAVRPVHETEQRNAAPVIDASSDEDGPLQEPALAPMTRPLDHDLDGACYGAERTSRGRLGQPVLPAAVPARSVPAFADPLSHASAAKPAAYGIGERSVVAEDAEEPVVAAAVAISAVCDGLEHPRYGADEASYAMAPSGLRGREQQPSARAQVALHTRKRGAVLLDGEEEPPANGADVDEIYDDGKPDAMTVRATGQVLRVVRGKCLVHTDSILVSDLQSDIYPYTTRRTCCIMEDGVRCGAFAGLVFHCPHKDADGVEDCGYCVCERHLRTTVVEEIKIAVLAGIRSFLAKGLTWVVYYVVVTIAFALYVPVMRTAVMLLACHPQFQCVFPGCYDKPTQDYIATVYLAALVALTFGLGFPLAFYVILRGRQQTLSRVFLSPSYRGAYEEPTAPENTHAVNAARVVRAGATRVSEALRAAAASLVDPDAVTPDGSVCNEVGFGTDMGVSESRRRGLFVLPESADAELRGVVTLERFCERDNAAAMALIDLPVNRRAACPDPADDDLASDTAAFVRRWLLQHRAAAAPTSDEDAAAIVDPPPAATTVLDIDATQCESDFSEGPATPLSVSVVSTGSGASVGVAAVERRATFRMPCNEGRRGPLGPEGSAPIVSFAAAPEDRETRTAADNAAENASDEGGELGMVSSMVVGGRSGYFAPKADDDVSGEGNDTRTLGTSLAYDVAHAAIADIALFDSPVLGFPHGAILKLQSGLASLAEYRRFLMTDPSAMMLMYSQLAFDAMHLVPVLTCGKFVLLIPPIVMNPDSLEQLLAIAAGELGFASFLWLRAPYHSMWMVIIVLLGNIHQFTLVGLKARILAMSHSEDLAEDVGFGMMALSLGYLLVVTALVLVMTQGDMIVDIIAESRLNKAMERLGVTRPKNAPLFIAPTIQPVELTPLDLPSDFADSSEDERDFREASTLGGGGGQVDRPRRRRRGAAQNLPEDDDAVAVELQRWRAHKKRMADKEKRRRKELREAQQQEQAYGVS